MWPRCHRGEVEWGIEIFLAPDDVPRVDIDAPNFTIFREVRELIIRPDAQPKSNMRFDFCRKKSEEFRKLISFSISDLPPARKASTVFP
jgi:hypothetical protein